jgi:hypothetical protein
LMWRRVTLSTSPALGRDTRARIPRVGCSPGLSARINRWQASWRRRSRDCRLPRSENWSARLVLRRANSCSIEPRISGCTCRGKPTKHSVLVPPILRRLSIAQPIRCGRPDREPGYSSMGWKDFQNCDGWRTGRDRPTSLRNGSPLWSGPKAGRTAFAVCGRLRVRPMPKRCVVKSGPACQSLLALVNRLAVLDGLQNLDILDFDRVDLQGV